MRGTKARMLRRFAALEFAHRHGLPYQRMSELFIPPLAAVRLPQSRRHGAYAARIMADTAQAFYQHLKRKYVQTNPANQRRERIRGLTGMVFRVRGSDR